MECLDCDSVLFACNWNLDSVQLTLFRDKTSGIFSVGIEHEFGVADALTNLFC